ncbi:MAG: hypothetical protein PHT44_03470 [Candidatus Portnoybacteria bacterium]|nr:hypothetical protein [Candidatus Portnoybacteria bacterium]MDD4983114.1 hypothetical protein [Candidatus Portnoybacteria bacterium]
MDSDIKDQFSKIISMIEEMKRSNLEGLKQKVDALDLREITGMLREIKSRVEIIESKIQK